MPDEILPGCAAASLRERLVRKSRVSCSAAFSGSASVMEENNSSRAILQR